MHNIVQNADCIGPDGMCRIKSKSVKLVCCDVPFGCTENQWDTVIPFNLMWSELLRIAADDAAIVLMGKHPFTAALITSQIKLFKYNYIFPTRRKTGFLNANKMPLSNYIDIPVFYRQQPVYNPQKTTGHKPVNKFTKRTGDGTNYGKGKMVSGGGQTDRHPTLILDIDYKDFKRFHPTQKPVELYEWMYRTYTNSGDTVLDFCAGYGTAVIAGINTGRNVIAFDNGVCEKPGGFYGIPWADLANERIKKHLEGMKL